MSAAEKRARYHATSLSLAKNGFQSAATIKQNVSTYSHLIGSTTNAADYSVENLILLTAFSTPTSSLKCPTSITSPDLECPDLRKSDLTSVGDTLTCGKNPAPVATTSFSLQSFAKYIWNLVGFTENLHLK